MVPRAEGKKRKRIHVHGKEKKRRKGRRRDVFSALKSLR
jgi:hypothetical protein